MSKGDWVMVRAYGGEVLRRRLAAENDRLVYVCTDDEYEAATREDREPNAVGFYREAIVGETEARR